MITEKRWSQYDKAQKEIITKKLGKDFNKLDKTEVDLVLAGIDTVEPIKIKKNVFKKKAK